MQPRRIRRQEYWELVETCRHFFSMETGGRGIGFHYKKDRKEPEGGNNVNIDEDGHTGLNGSLYTIGKYVDGKCKQCGVTLTLTTAMGTEKQTFSLRNLL